MTRPLPWRLADAPDAPFPPAETALRQPDGLLAVGGDLHPVRLLNAYAGGIFPWFSGVPAGLPAVFSINGGTAPTSTTLATRLLPWRLKPMDNTQMVAQMAQMSTVQGITDLNKTVKGFQESMASDQVLRGAALVGHQVLVPSEKLVLEKEGSVEGTVAAPSAGIITVDITDANGTKVTSLSVEAKAAGETAFKWDGKDANGKRMEPGKYSVVANHVDTAGKSTKLSTYVQAPVESVTVGSDGLYLNLKGLGTAPIDYVLRVS